MLFQTVKSIWVLVPRFVSMLGTSLSEEARLALQLMLTQVSSDCQQCRRTALALNSNVTVSHVAVRKCVWTDTRHLFAPCQSHRVPGLQGTWGLARGSLLEVAFHELSPLRSTQAASCRDGLLGRQIVLGRRGRGRKGGGLGESAHIGPISYYCIQNISSNRY